MVDLIRITAAVIVGALLLWAGSWVLYFLIEWAQPDQGFRKAFEESTERQLQVFGAAIGAASFFLLGLNEFLDAAAAFIASHPFGVTNALGISLGALGLAGIVDLPVWIWVAGGVLATGVVLVVVGVRRDD